MISHKGLKLWAACEAVKRIACHVFFSECGLSSSFLRYVQRVDVGPSVSGLGWTWRCARLGGAFLIWIHIPLKRGEALPRKGGLLKLVFVRSLNCSNSPGLVLTNSTRYRAHSDKRRVPCIIVRLQSSR